MIYNVKELKKRQLIWTWIIGESQPKQVEFVSELPCNGFQYLENGQLYYIYFGWESENPQLNNLIVTDTREELINYKISLLQNEMKVAGQEIEKLIKLRETC